LKIWTDDKFPFLADDLQLVFFHLLTTPAQTSLGLICVAAESLAAEKRWNADRYKKRLREGEDAGLWAYTELTAEDLTTTGWTILNEDEISALWKIGEDEPAIIPILSRHWRQGRSLRAASCSSIQLSYCVMNNK